MVPWQKIHEAFKGTVERIIGPRMVSDFKEGRSQRLRVRPRRRQPRRQVPHPSKRKPYLPADKQYLITRNVHCLRRAPRWRRNTTPPEGSIIVWDSLATPAGSARKKEISCNVTTLLDHTIKVWVAKESENLEVAYIRTEEVINNKIIKKRIHVRVEHVQPSRCTEEFHLRKNKNDQLKAEAKACGEIINTKRQPEDPKPGFMVEAATLETVTPIPYDVVNDLKGGY